MRCFIISCCFLGNPLEEKHSGEGDWRDQATRRLPRLKKLDGKNLVLSVWYLNKSGRLMLFLQGTAIVIMLPALASKTYRVDVNHYVLNSFNQFYPAILSDERFSNLVPPRHKASHNLRLLHTFTHRPL